MQKKLVRITSAVIVAVLMLIEGAAPALAWGWGGGWNDWDEWEDRIPHGTMDEWVTEDQLENTPDPNYAVNPDTQADGKDGAYNAFFLEDSIQTVKIYIDDYNLNYLLQKADQEPYVMTERVTIGDTTLKYCGLRTKGNYTLAHAYTDNPGSDRFSFTINFGKYIKKQQYGEKQNFYGCDKISFNNFFFDKTMMKEFFSLKLMDEMGLPTPQYGIAKLYINNEYYGVYAMVEAMDKPILEQYFDCDSKELTDYLVKPTGTKLNYFDLLEDQTPLWEYDMDKYADLEPMLPTVMEWVRRLNCLSEGTDFDGNQLDVNSQEYLELLRQVIDVDEFVRYFAAHSWLCQMDNMFMCEQNYGIYISEEGVCTIVPWDYDLSFGCYFPSTAEDTANYPLDIMFSLNRWEWEGAEERTARAYKNYPLFNVIYQNKELMELYHTYMLDCSKIAALGGTTQATGKTYDPAYFNSFIVRMEDELLEAASETLADNVYYMNWIDQPKGVKQGLPNLAKIMALRAVGVRNQVEGLDAVVCASGCNLETLGNAAKGGVSNSGLLTLIDESSSVFITAEFDESRLIPMFTATALDENYSEYEDAKKLYTVPFGGEVMVYELYCSKKPTDGYNVTVPLAQEYLQLGYTREFYASTEGQLRRVSVERSGNLFTA